MSRELCIKIINRLLAEKLTDEQIYRVFFLVNGMCGNKM